MEDLITLIKTNDIEKNAEKRGAFFPLTDIYNEGWLLRLALSKGLVQKQLHCEQSEKWFSEAQLKSPFLHGKLRETRTHADAVIGSYRFEDKTATGVEIDKENFSFFYAIEAKIYAPLSKGISSCKDYNQAVRYIGCIAKMACDVDLSDEDFGKLGLFVITPEKQRNKIKDYLSKESIRNLLTQRITEYKRFPENQTEEFTKWKNWWIDCNDVFLQNISIEPIDWENIIDDDLSVFYQKCLDYNKKEKH